MRDPLRSRSRRTLRVALAIVAAGAGLATIYSCSLIVDQQSQQCQSDSDCSAFPGAKCDTTNGICVSATTTSSGTTGGSTTTTTTTTTSSSTSTTSSTSTSSGSPCDVNGGVDGGGCYDDSLAACSLSTDPVTLNSQLLNACTTGCIAFDNSVLGLVNGQLPPLPTVPPDGGF